MRSLIFFLLFTLSAHAAEANIDQVSDNEFAFKVGESRLTVEIRDVVLLGKKDLLLDWVRSSARLVEKYYARFPVQSVKIALQVTGGHAVRFGQAFGGESPFIRIVIGEDINPEMLKRDWILVHEMVHLAMADIPRSHRWFLEGLATYVESIARAQNGDLAPDFVWNGFINRMPQGLPKSGDQGLDVTHTWGRTYWGGAIFCLLADVEIRRITDNKHSLRDALRGVLNDGYSMEASTSIRQVLESADRAIGVAVLLPLYEKMRADPYPVNLPALWQSLGVSLKNDKVYYDDSAPMSAIRQSMLSGQSM
ncbi:MAG: hypothetical protein ACI9LO_000695 [Planctomycetota bacterium]|jgi:hypothetical protein